MSTSQTPSVPVTRIVGEEVEGTIFGPGPEREQDLPFRPRRMVGWFDPAQLARTALRAVVSELFGEYADKREVQAALNRPGIYDYSGAEGSFTDDNGDLWIDYLADLGDGFHSTYSVAWLLAQPELRLGAQPDSPLTRRGRITVMGGDQVYPTASRTEYQERLAGPYEAALPCAPHSTAPHLFAIPGNHDWYDGLTSFVRLFCQERWIGGWRTRQTRSYFALKLPHGWWLWGTDIALDADIDEPQLDYFRDVAERQMEPGDRIILCTAEPSWVFSGTYNPAAYQNLEFFEREIVRRSGKSLSITLTGDMHHYARYERKSGGDHKITAGGGGAYLVATHHLPEEITLAYRRPRDSERFVPQEDRIAFERKAAYPTVEESRELARGARHFGPLNRTFGNLLGGAYAILGGLLYAFLHAVVDLSPDVGADGGLPEAQALSPGLMDMIALPMFGLLSLVLLGGLYGLAGLTPGITRRQGLGAGVPHWIAHMLTLIAATGALFALAGSLHLPETGWMGSLTNVAVGLAVLGVLALLGSRVGSWIVGRYLIWADRRGINSNETFSAQRIEDFKNFLRLRIDANGDLTVFPVKVPRVCRKWGFIPNAQAGKPFFRPLEDLGAELIESPILVKRPRTARSATEVTG